MDFKKLSKLPLAEGGSPLDGSAKLFEKGKRTLLQSNSREEALAKFENLRSGTHPALKSPPFVLEYVLPIRLFDSVVQSVGESRFDQQALGYDRMLTGRIRGDREVGFWGEHRIQCDLLLAKPFRQDASKLDAVALGINEDQLKKVIKTINKRLEFIEEPRKGYAGWLSANPTFVAEHDALLRQYRERFLMDGFPVLQEATDLAAPRQYVRAHPPQSIDELTSLGSWQLSEDAWLIDYRRFCERWRLSHLAGPYLPEPDAPQFPIGVAPSAGTQAFLIPDIYPIGGQGMIGEAIEDALRGGTKSEREHLTDWFNIVNAARNQFDRFGRLLRLQHYWRVLHQRHAAALRRRKEQLYAVFAKFLSKSDESIRKDVQEIDRALGVDWPERADPLSDSPGRG